MMVIGVLIIGLGYSEESQNAGSSTLKRTKHSHALPPQFLHIHQVDCNESGIHAGHGTVSYFFDRPRLFAGDCKASRLRGMMVAHITQDYLDDHPELSFIVYESYNCNEYHELLKNDFERIQMPHIDKLALIQLRPYLFIFGDIGTDPEGVEKYLDSVLYIGTLWGCVVLLDEADIFLEERTQMDLQRNALVSVFLRVLEYYEGILILTTNRVGTFDEAFKSRVQLSMHYPTLDRKGRREIWHNFLNVLQSEEESMDYEELEFKLDALAAHEINGRQIRNTINTARKLAMYRKEKLRYVHFDLPLDVAIEFEEYVVKTHGYTAEEWARSQRTRY